MLRTIATIFKVCFYGFIILLGVTFAVSNRGMVDLTFYPVPYIVSLPLFLFTVAIFLVGLFIGWSIARLKVGSHKRAYRQAAKRAAALENELGVLRTERQIAPVSTAALPQK